MPSLKRIDRDGVDGTVSNVDIELLEQIGHASDADKISITTSGQTRLNFVRSSSAIASSRARESHDASGDRSDPSGKRKPADDPNTMPPAGSAERRSGTAASTLRGPPSLSTANTTDRRVRPGPTAE